jgi:hypothetical protein
VQGAFGIVVFAVVIIAVIVAAVTLTSGSSAYDQIGRGGLSINDERGRGRIDPPLDSSAGQAERDREIRQMLEARNERLKRKGAPTVDVEAEIARLDKSASQQDPDLLDEVRALVVARNERLMRQGQEPLDVEAEVERTLRELGQ